MTGEVWRVEFSRVSVLKNKGTPDNLMRDFSKLLNRPGIFIHNRIPEPEPTRNGPVRFGFGSRQFIRWVLVLIIHGYRFGSGFYPKPNGYPFNPNSMLKKHRFVSFEG